MRAIIVLIGLLLITNQTKSQDFTPPTAICESHLTVSLSYGRNFIHAREIDRGSYDNVGITRYEIRRMTDACGIPANLNFGPTIELCCDDAGTRFMVALQLRDQAGNISQCMSEVIVQDKTTPVVYCLPDITVSCKYRGYAPSTFGSFTGDPAQRNKIILDGKFWGMDGLYTGGCGQFPIQETTNYIKGNCHTTYDQLVRIFYFPQYPGQQCIQTITFVPDSQFEINDVTCFNEDPTDGVIWPCDYETSDCMPQGGLNPDVTGRPELIKGDQCGLIATNYHDQRFKIPGSACAKILRDWIVFDWCNQRQWRYTQTILVVESRKPVIHDCRDTVITSQDQACKTALYSTRIDVTDDCTPYDSLRFRYKLDIGNDGTIDTLAYEDSLSILLPFGEHTLYWDIDDGCSNVASCARNIRVIDGKAPTPVCRNGIITVIMPIFGMIELEASSFNLYSFDNCTPDEDLKYSFSTDPDDIRKLINCDSIEQNGSDTFLISMYVTDQSGLQDHCLTRVIIQDNDQVCGSTVTATVAGQIIGPQGDPVNGIQMRIQPAGNATTLKTFQVEGDAFSEVLRLPQAALNAGVSLTAEKWDEVSRGLSVADMVILQRHLLGKEEIRSPAQLLAGDVDGSGKLSAKDLLVMQRMILGLTTEFPGGTPPWYFLDEQALTEDASARAYRMLNTDPLNASLHRFAVVKTGDLNHSWSFDEQARLEKRTDDPFVFYVEKDISPEHSIIGFSIKAENLSQITGFQGTFEFDPALLEFVQVVRGVLNVNQDNFNLSVLSEGYLPMVWTAKQGVSIEPDEVLFTLFFRVKKGETPETPYSLDFGSSTVTAQGVSGDGTQIQVILKPKNDQQQDHFADQVFQAFPNPVKDMITIPMTLASDSDVNVRFYNMQGMCMASKDFRLLEGERSLDLDLDEFSGGGIYLLVTRIGSWSHTQRIVIIP